MNPNEQTPDPAPTAPSSGNAHARQYLHPVAPRSASSRPLTHRPTPEEPQPRTEYSQAYAHNPAAYDWQQYHTAWQQYYQQYYHHYYTQLLLAQQQQPPSQAEEQQPIAPAPLDQTITGSDHSVIPPSRIQQLRNQLRHQIHTRARALRGSSHFVPIVSALVVGVLFVALQFNRLVVAQIEAYISPGSTVDVSDTIVVDPSANANVGPEPTLIIPKINVNVPVVYDVATVDDRAVQAGLEKGVIRYNLSGANSLPGQTGNMVILGHSSNDVFDPGGYKFTFVLLDRLQPGDLFYIHYQAKRYVYKVSEHKIIKPTDWKVLQQNSGKPAVILVTCNPVGTSLNRLLVYGEQISPDPATAAAQPAQGQETNPAHIPGNSPTFFERLGDILF